MKVRNILLGVFTLINLAIYAQTDDKNDIVTSENAVTEFKVETDKIEELQNFDWDAVREMFKGNNPEQEITLEFSHKNNSEEDKSKVRVNSHTMKVTGKTANLEKLINMLQNSFNKLKKIEEIGVKS